MLVERTQQRACFIESWCRGGAGLGADHQVGPSGREAGYQHCPKDQLKTLPGIGDSQKIIDGRPYRSKLDLVVRPKSKEKIIAKQPKATGMAPASPE